MAQRVGRGIALLFRERGTRRGEWSAARPGRTLPQGKTRYPFYRRLGGPQGRSGWAEHLVPTGIRSRTFQPVAQSLYRLSYPAHNRVHWLDNKACDIIDARCNFEGLFILWYPNVHHRVHNIPTTRPFPVDALKSYLFGIHSNIIPSTTRFLSWSFTTRFSH